MYNFVVLSCGSTLKQFEQFASVMRVLPATPIPMLRYLTEMALDLDYRHERLLNLVATLGSMGSDYLRSEQETRLKRIVGDLGMALFNSVDNVLGPAAVMCRRPGDRHELSDFRYAGPCERGVIIDRSHAYEQPSIFER